MFALLYGGSLCVIGGLALVAVACLSGAQRRKYERQWIAGASAHNAEIVGWHERYKRLAARCKELERELTEIKLGTATAGYAFEQVPARTVPARVRMVKAR